MITGKEAVDDDNGFCENVKKITAIFNNKEFDKLKGKEIKDASNDKQYVSSVDLKGYINQTLYETDKEIYFTATLNEKLRNADALKEKLKILVKNLESCLAVEMEYKQTQSFIIYRVVLDSGVKVELTGNYPDEKRRYINLDVSYKKN